MSTKTTFKRIALVTVAALGFGVMSVAPSSASINADQLTHSLAASCGSLNNVYSGCGDVVSDTNNVLINTAQVYPLQQSFTATAATDTATVSIKMTVNAYNESATTRDGIAAYSSPAVMPSVTLGSNASYNLTLNASQSVSDTTVSNGPIGNTFPKNVAGTMLYSFTPVMRGTYVFTFTAQSGTTSTPHTWTVKAYATQAELDAANGVDNAISAAKTTSFLNTGETTTATADATVIASMAVTTSAAATIVVLPKNAAGTTIANVTFPLTATISGPGTLAIGTDLAAITALSSGTGRAITGTTNHYVIGVFADGTSGVSTITISSGTTVLATETVTFYGAAAKITPTVVNSVLAIGVNTGAVTAVVTDAAGVAVPNVTVYAVSGTDATIDSDAYQASTAGSTSAGAVSINLTGVAAGTATITLTLNSTSAGTSTVSVLAGTMRVSDGVATKVDYTFDKDSYAPGQAAVVKATVSNAAGVMPAGTYTVLSSAGVTANYTVSGLPAATVLAVLSTGAATYTVTIPTGITGDLQLVGTASATTITATFGKATVVNAALDAATAATDAATEAIDNGASATDSANIAAESADAATAAAQDAADLASEAGSIAQTAADTAAEALEAANAATDAANAAAESADAATSAALDAVDAANAATAAANAASDAVAALATQMATALSGIKAQITALTNLIVKIQKKVKA